MQLRSIEDKEAIYRLECALKPIEQRQHDPERCARVGPNWHDVAELHRYWGRFLYLGGNKLRRLQASTDDTIPSNDWDQHFADLADVETICKLGLEDATRYVRVRLLSLMGTTAIADKPTAKRNRGGTGRGSQQLSRTFA